MGYTTIEVREAGAVAVLTLNRPAVMNALTSTLRSELLQAIRHHQDTARCIVLTGSGRAFCSGQDLVDAGDPRTLDFERALNDEYVPLLSAIYECPVPTIAAVNGVAAGAGANLALACDVVIATESASFIQAFTRIGLMPDAGGTYWLPRQVGAARAMGAMLFAEPVSARQAAEWGMIWEAVPDKEFDAHWRVRAAQLAAGPTLAYGEVKRALRGSPDRTLSQQLATEAAGQARCGASADFAEGVAAFIEKRPARFGGR